jgi:DNA-binding transcriptional MerR regulator
VINLDELINIRKVSKSFGISTRTIRYYEEIGLLESKRPDGSKYRFYDKESIHKLEQILLLRSVKFSLEDISRILSCKNSTESLVMLQQRADELGKQIKSLSETKRIVDSIVKISNENETKAHVKKTKSIIDIVPLKILVERVLEIEA